MSSQQNCWEENALIVIADSINSSDPEVFRSIRERDAGFIGSLAESLANAGADFIDVNVSAAGEGNEKDAMLWAVGVVRKRVDTPLSIDSVNPDVIVNAIRFLGERGNLVNSVSLTERSLEVIPPVATRYECKVIALCMRGHEPSDDPSERVSACVEIRDRLLSAGIREEDILFDPLVRPVSVRHHNALITLKTMERIRRELPGTKTVLGLRNVSFGLPRRDLLDAAFLAMALYVGVDAVMIDPRTRFIREFLLASRVVAGLDAYSRAYVGHFRGKK